jgi:hypothetical protein
MPTRVTPRETSQSRRPRRSSVKVGKLASLVSRPPEGPGTLTQATTESLCTSSPAQRSTTISMGNLLLAGVGTRRAGRSRLGNLGLALEAAFIGAQDLHVTLMTGYCCTKVARRRRRDAPIYFPIHQVAARPLSLMVQCSRWHVIPQVVPVILTNQQAHDLDIELKLGPRRVLTCWRLGNQPHSLPKRGGRCPLGQESLPNLAPQCRRVAGFRPFLYYLICRPLRGLGGTAW